MCKKRTTRSSRRVRREGPAALGARPAEQLRVIFDERGQPVLKPFPPDIRWMVRTYGD